MTLTHWIVVWTFAYVGYTMAPFMATEPTLAQEVLLSLIYGIVGFMVVYGLFVNDGENE